MEVRWRRPEKTVTYIHGVSGVGRVSHFPANAVEAAMGRGRKKETEAGGAGPAANRENFRVNGREAGRAGETRAENASVTKQGRVTVTVETILGAGSAGAVQLPRRPA